MTKFDKGPFFTSIQAHDDVRRDTIDFAWNGHDETLTLLNKAFSALFKK